MRQFTLLGRTEPSEPLEFVLVTKTLVVDSTWKVSSCHTWNLRFLFSIRFKAGFMVLVNIQLEFTKVAVYWPNKKLGYLLSNSLKPKVDIKKRK